jgi:transcriptional regulator with XRE-family HTH domain
MEHIGQKIKDLRKKADLTQDRLADYLGVSAQAISKWEVGQTAPDLALIVPLCRVLGVSADELLGVKNEPEEDRAFREQVERIIREEWPEEIGPGFDFDKVSWYLKNVEFRVQLSLGRQITEDMIRHSVKWLAKEDRECNGIHDPRGWSPIFEDYREQLRSRALSGDRDALDLCVAMGEEEGRLPGYEKAFALCFILGATEIVNVDAGFVPHAARLLRHTGFRYTGINCWSDADRFNRLLRPYGDRMRFLKADWPDCEIHPGEGAICLFFMTHWHDRDPDGKLRPVAEQFGRALVQINSPEQEAAFRKAFDGFHVRVLYEKNEFGTFSGKVRSRHALYYVTKFREDAVLLDEIGYCWNDTRFLYADPYFRDSYYDRWRDAIRETRDREQEECNRRYEIVGRLWDMLPDLAVSEEERETLAKQAEDRGSRCVAPTVGGAYGVMSYHLWAEPAKLCRDGEEDFTYAEGTEEFEGQRIEFKAFVRGGLVRTVEFRYADPDEQPDPCDPGIRYRREQAEYHAKWMEEEDAKVHKEREAEEKSGG